MYPNLSTLEYQYYIYGKQKKNQNTDILKTIAIKEPLLSLF